MRFPPASCSSRQSLAGGVSSKPPSHRWSWWKRKRLNPSKSQHPDAQSFHFTPPPLSQVCALVFYTVVPHWKTWRQKSKPSSALERENRGLSAHVVAFCSLSATLISPRIIRFMLGCSFTRLRGERANFDPRDHSTYWSISNQLKIQAIKGGSCSLSRYQNTTALIKCTFGDFQTLSRKRDTSGVQVSKPELNRVQDCNWGEKDLV